MSNTNVPVNVFGTVATVNEIKRKAGLEITTSTDSKEDVKDKRLFGDSSEQAFRIGGRDEVPTVTEEEKKILRNTILRNNPEEVYMQEDVSFYDGYYLSEHHIDDALMEEVRKIRRIYKNYPKYLYACLIRDQYLDLLEEKYGTSSPLAIAKGLTLIDIPKGTFIPPEPIYSRNAPDYNKSMSDRMGTYLPYEKLSNEEFFELIKDVSGLDINPEDIKVDSHGIMTKKEVLDYYPNDGDNNTTQFSGRSINVKDLDIIQKMIRSWNKPEKTTKTEERNNIPFPDSEQGIYNQIRWRISYELMEAMEHPVETKDTDMVYDEVTKKPMTRKELNQRVLARTLGEYGWDTLKVMSQLGIGSKVDRMIDRTKSKKRKKARKKAASFFSDIMGGDDTYDDPATDIEGLHSFLFDD